jgi:hypothetical protein
LALLLGRVRQFDRSSAPPVWKRWLSSAPATGASVIAKIAHLSSVSGGSIAATYYPLKKPDC